MELRSNTTTAGPVVSLRMSRRKRDEFDDAAAKLGISRAELIRRRTRSATLEPFDPHAGTDWH